MSNFDEHQLPEELRDVADRLRAERPEASGLELDRAKLRAMTRAPERSTTRRRFWRTRAVSTGLAVVLLAAGAAAIGGGSGGVPSLSVTQTKSASSQYCPPTSQQPGKPKNPSPDGCGNPKTK